MRAAVFGTGGVGGYFGGLLANAGHDVTFIARGSHFKAIQQNGLLVNSIHGDFHIFPAQATDDPGEVGPVDYVIVAVKDYQLREAAKNIPSLVGTETAVVPLLNGVDAHEILIEAVGNKPVVGGLCVVIAYIDAPGVIRQASKQRRVVVGELTHQKSERVENLMQFWNATGVEAIQSADIHVSIWNKFAFISSFSGIGSLVQAPIGDWRDIAECRALFIEALNEVAAVARAGGINLPSNVVDNGVGMADALEYGATASMQRDVAAGNLFELEAFSGKIVHLGEKLGIPTPIHRTMYRLLLPILIKAMRTQG